MKIANFYKPFLLLCLIFVWVAELGLVTFWQKNYTVNTKPYLFFLAQLLIGIFPLMIGYYKKHTISDKHKPFKRIFFPVYGSIGLLITLFLFSENFSRLPISLSLSDIIPQVQKFTSRFVKGEFPYAVFSDFGWAMQPTYLPAQWLPFLPAQIFGIDPRWTCFAVFAIGFVFYIKNVIKSNLPPSNSALLMAMPVIFFSAIHDHQNTIFRITIELLITGYYFLLTTSLARNNIFFQSLMIVLCLMSRFSLLFWLPLYAFMVWQEHGWRVFSRYAALIFGGCVLLYGLFLWKDPLIFFKAQTYYDDASVGEWSRSRPNHLDSGLGFAVLFHEKGGDTMQNILKLKKMMLISTPSVSVVLGIIWWRMKAKINFSLFAICSLKISLAFFYSFVQIPYAYLYVTPLIVSIGVLYKTSDVFWGNE